VVEPLEIAAPPPLGADTATFAQKARKSKKVAKVSRPRDLVVEPPPSLGATTTNETATLTLTATLAALLKDCRKLSTEVCAAVGRKKDDLTLKKAKRRLGIRSYREGDSWWWEMPRQSETKET